MAATSAPRRPRYLVHSRTCGDAGTVDTPVRRCRGLSKPWRLDSGRLQAFGHPHLPGRVARSSDYKAAATYERTAVPRVQLICAFAALGSSRPPRMYLVTVCALSGRDAGLRICGLADYFSQGVRLSGLSARPCRSLPHASYAIAKRRWRARAAKTAGSSCTLTVVC